MRKKGFTLIELLVVISIIAVLMSIMMPALGKARKQAQSTICLASLKQWGIIFTLYTDDSKGKFPEGHNSTGQVWMEAVRDYYQNIGEIRCCPTATKTWYSIDNGTEVAGPGSSKGTFTAWGVFKGTGWQPAGDFGSYTINSWVTDSQDDSYRPQDYWRTRNVNNASEIPLILDGLWVGVWPTISDKPGKIEESDPLGNNWRRVYVNRHRGTNMVYIDGSAKKIPLRNIWTTRWHRSHLQDVQRTTEPDWPAWIDK